MGQELPPDLPAGRRGALIRLVTRLLVAQAAAAGAVGLVFRLGHPGLGHPGLGHPGLGHPGLGHPGLGHPGLGEPGLGDPGPADREQGQA